LEPWPGGRWAFRLEAVKMDGFVSKKDLRRILELSGEVAEISTGEERIEHFLTGVMLLTQTDVLGMATMTREGDCYKLGTGYALGLDESGAKVMHEWYLQGGAYRADPFTRGIIRSGEATARRQDLLEKSEWYSDPHIEGLKSMGLDGVMAAVRDTKNHKIGLVARREWGALAYSEEDREKLDLIASAFQWFFYSLEADGYFGPSLEVPTRLQQVLDGLLKGLTEKEIAAGLMLSPRTVHKYVEQLFRHFRVNSRPQLMALWTRYPRRSEPDGLIVHH